MEKIKVGVLVGSLRTGAFSRAVADALVGFLPAGVEAEVLEIGNLTMFNQDLEAEGRTPAEWEAFRAKVQEKQAYLFVTPEYNRSFPAVLKNALDIGSRPYGKNSWGGKPAAVVSVSPGKLGGFGSNHHLRQVLAFLDVYTMQQPEAYVGEVHESLDKDGKVASEALNGFLKQIADSFTRWIGRFAQ